VAQELLQLIIVIVIVAYR